MSVKVHAFGERIASIQAETSVGSPRPLAKSFPEPVGIYPRIICSGCSMPFNTSLTVPSPPTTISVVREERSFVSCCASFVPFFKIEV